ncbi:hypothetical protein ABZT03_20520 [Streptomyces sp. NPDC005574]|uniref:hypothetical protein n=1 Tax=Streptomyces sp. NPDC005574 TaxID=3156891 RepID=UPI0033B70EB9
MLLSSLVSAADPSTAALYGTAATCFVTGGLGALTLTHHKQALAWVKDIRRKDEDTAELLAPAEALEALYKEQCGLARKPCTAKDFAEVSRIAHMIRGRVEHTGTIGADLTKVVERVEHYLQTALPEPATPARIALADHEIRMVQAMRQEAARIDLERTVTNAQQKINNLRRV